MHAFRWIFALFAVGLTGIMSCESLFERLKLPVVTVSSTPMSSAMTATCSTTTPAPPRPQCALRRRRARTDLTVEDEGYEGCDDGNDADEDGCTVACALAVCGDGIVRADIAAGEGEACDDGNGEDTDGCNRLRGGALRRRRLAAGPTGGRARL